MEAAVMFALYASLGYFGGLTAAQLGGAKLLNQGKLREASACFRICSKVSWNGRDRALMRANLISTLNLLGDMHECDRVWRSVRRDLKDAGPLRTLLVSSYGSSLFCRGQYRECVELLSDPEVRLFRSYNDLPENYAGGREPDSWSVCQKYPLAREGEIMRLLCMAQAMLELGGEYLQHAQQIMACAARFRMRNVLLRNNFALVLARLCWRRGDLEQAYREAREVDTSALPVIYREDMLLQKAVLMAVCGKPDLAEMALDCPPGVKGQRSAVLRPLAEGLLCECRRDPLGAVRHYDRALRCGWPAGEPALRGAHLAERKGDTRLAVWFAEQALHTDPQSCWASMAGKILQRAASRR